MPIGPELILFIGRLTTFNFDGPQPSAHLDKQQYMMCIRQELGKYKITIPNSKIQVLILL